jgi:type VI secretion system protein ImpM
MSVNATPGAGFCGKLPIRADFITRRLPLAYVERWHDWLAECLAGLRDALGEGWLDAYLYGPIWRFAVPAGLAGPHAVAGTLMPSVDSVGRYFPLTIALPLASPEALVSMALEGRSWFDGAEACSLAALEGELDIDMLGERLAALALPALIVRSGVASGTSPAVPRPGRAFILGIEEGAGENFLAQHAAPQLMAGNSLWWTRGAESMPPAVAIASYLPMPASFAAMLIGEWAKYGWQEDDLTRLDVLTTDAITGGETLD